jgi:hypothetical protein
LNYYVSSKKGGFNFSYTELAKKNCYVALFVKQISDAHLHAGVPTSTELIDNKKPERPALKSATGARLRQIEFTQKYSDNQALV